MARIVYTGNLLNTINKEKLKKDIISAAVSSPELRKEIRRIFQMANRRIQNIEKAGLLSPAVMGLHKDGVKGFAKFSMSGKTWDELKIEYGKAVAFLRQPTSTASGTRQYNEHLMKAYDLTKDEFDAMARNLQGKLSSLSESNFVEQYLMRYKDFTGELEQSASDVSTQIESEAVSIQRALDKNLQSEADKVVRHITDIQDELFKALE